VSHSSDEIASGSGHRPGEIPVKYLAGNQRAPTRFSGAQKAGWKEAPVAGTEVNGHKNDRAGVAVGNAPNTNHCRRSRSGVDTRSGKVIVKRVTLAHDCGLIVNRTDSRIRLKEM